ncbi:Protein of unknown function [Cognatiyoonia sediminum]|uniref:UDP-N-acetylmuramate--alanine ligase n=1 Tax=Cognatiyoonia sediminum TaxID=1508389 RepID=A0A1M5L9B5_9RHOB|nr:DUF2484 family protein [Cognatiyoonia sediminum]SHG61702.1 Protein of unknown function [Cognatiyoonia sediminum]
MTLSLILGCLWGMASAVVAMLPMQRQFGPGIVLLIAAPVLIVWIGYDYGWWLSIAAALAFLSMYRNPLRYLWKKATGQEVEVPK